MDNIRDVVAAALTDAQNEKIEDISDLGKLHRERSKSFVECLSSRLFETLGGSDLLASLSKHHDDDRAKFGMNELLFDVAVVEYGTVDSGISGKELIFVRNGVWAVESELARDKRQALFDFNKLVLAATDNKLFVGPRVGDEEDYLRVLGEAAQHCTGRVYVALIPHPDEWPEKGSQDVLAWAWEAWGLVAIP